MTEVIRMCR